MLVRLTSFEVSHCAKLARARNDPKQHLDESTPWGRESARRRAEGYKLGDSYFNHFIGLLGEAATAKLLGLQLDEELHAGDRHAGDLALPDGRRVQVKTRLRRGWDFALTTNRPSEFRAAYGVLCWPAPGRCEPWFSSREVKPLVDLGVLGRMEIDCVGFVSQASFWRFAKEVDYGYGTRLALAPHYLSCFPRAVCDCHHSRLFSRLTAVQGSW